MFSTPQKVLLGGLLLPQPLVHPVLFRDLLPGPMLMGVDSAYPKKIKGHIDTQDPLMGKYIVERVWSQDKTLLS